MNNDGKKITFSFSKVKKPALVNKAKPEVEKKEYVDCFDGSKGKFSYKGNIRNDEAPKKELIIQMPTTRTSTDIVKCRIEAKGNKTLELFVNNKTEKKKNVENKTNQNQSKNIEVLAALEILDEVKNGHTEKKEANSLIIDAKDFLQEASETDIDYENVPVSDFGLAMLRGMGWKPNYGIGKEPRLVEAASPKLRPKGLGLGAQLNTETNSEKKDKKKNIKSST